MITIACDVCKKKMDNPMYGRNFFIYSNHSICEPCKDGLENQVKGVIRSRDPFMSDWYEKYMKDTLDKAVQKGRI